MSKPTDNVLLVPGETGWEIWTAAPGQESILHSATASHQASELTDIPSGELLLFFPVKAVTAVPMRVASDDDALFGDLASLHAERLGLRADPMAGQLTDVFVIAREPENSALSFVLLRAPGEGDLPPRGPKGFDISPRAFPLKGDALAVWMEFGRWVFSLYHQGKLVYCQTTTSAALSPDDAFAREIRLALIQLTMQGLEIEPSRIVVWTSAPGVSPAALNAAFHAPVEIVTRPAPVVPAELSKLLPADVRAARRAADRKRNITLGVAAVGLLYLGLIGWFGYGLWKDSRETKQLITQAEQAGPEGAAYTQHMEKWDEIADAVERSNNPVEILKSVALCIPSKSGLRLRTADISSNEIKILGEAPQLQAVNSFSLSLSKSNDLARFGWQTPEPNQSATRGWEFVFTGEVTAPDAQP